MRKLKEIKLDALCQAELDARGMDLVRGGLGIYQCGCACAYEGDPNGGSSVAMNKTYNYDDGYDPGTFLCGLVEGTTNINWTEQARHFM